MTEIQEQGKDPIEQIMEDMVKDIENAENKDKEIEIQDETFQKENQNIPNSQEDSEEEREKRKIANQKRKLANLQRELARTKEEKNLIAEEALAYRNQYEMAISKAQTSSDAAMAHYQNSINLRREQLKEALKRAEDLNDVDAKADIDFEMAMLASEAKDIKAHNILQYQQQYQQPYVDPYASQYYQQQYQQPYQEPIEIPPETEQWARRNPWLIPDNEEYDPEKVQDVMAASKLLDSNLKRAGREDLIHTEYYYKELDNFIRSSYGEDPSHQSYNNTPSYNVPSQRNLEQSFSNNSRSHIAPVRKSGSGNYGSSNKVKFTDIDKDMIAQFQRFGVTPQDFAKAKLNITEKQRRDIENGDLVAMQQYGLI